MEFLAPVFSASGFFPFTLLTECPGKYSVEVARVRLSPNYVGTAEECITDYVLLMYCISGILTESNEPG